MGVRTKTHTQLNFLPRMKLRKVTPQVESVCDRRTINTEKNKLPQGPSVERPDVNRLDRKNLSERHSKIWYRVRMRTMEQETDNNLSFIDGKGSVHRL